MDNTKLIKNSIIAGTAILLGTTFALTGIKRVPANAVGVKVTPSGVQNKTLSTGYHFKTPFLDRIYIIPTQVQTKVMTDITTQTKDGQWLNTNIDVKYKINSSEAMEVFSNYTNLETVSEQVISPAVQRAIESVTGSYDIYDILGSKRTEVYDEIDEQLKKKFAEYNLEFVSFTITDQDAGDEIENAIKDESVKQKQVDSAKQDQEKAKIEAETKKINAQAEAETEVIKAQGKAQANRELANSINENLVRMKEMEAREKHGWVEVITKGDVITNNE